MKRKSDEPAAARDLYRSPLWDARRRYAESGDAPWFIISALHGLVEPSQKLTPYDLALGDLSAAQRRAWGEKVLTDLETLVGTLAGSTLEVHAGDAYARALATPAGERGARIEIPLGRVAGIGAQLRWYAHSAEDADESAPHEMEHRRGATDAEVAGAVRALDLAPAIISAADWPGVRDDLNACGLYAWWVDATGARDLSLALGASVYPGRIYLGQTGATKWPSGRTGSNTLRRRVRQHISGQIRGSTFRLTLGAALATTLSLEHVAPKRISSRSNADLTAWICSHLSVAVHPFADPAPLGDLERRVLALLDPPLNIDGMSPTALRARLSELRRALSATSI